MSVSSETSPQGASPQSTGSCLFSLRGLCVAKLTHSPQLLLVGLLQVHSPGHASRGCVQSMVLCGDLSVAIPAGRATPLVGL